MVAPGGQTEEVPNPLGLGCQAADSYLTWVLDSELPASAGATRS